MDIQDAQREVRSVYVGGFWGQLVASVIWMMSAALGTWVTPKASILTIVIGGFFIFPALSRENPFNSLAMQVAFVLPLSMLLLVPVGLYRLNWFFPALIVLVGDRKSTRLNSSHPSISYAVFCLKKKKIYKYS